MRKTVHRISALANQLNELQACLGRASGRPSKSVMEAQRIAAEVASLLEEWHLETFHIPETERDLYRVQNPYYAAH
ncbi:TPA: hypothetical protein MIT42_003379 [Klebsiella quasipneumoniae]|nr:hypothetical protein [Klebsiella pneumoniae]HDS3412750.1 hypothetical protein [Klebsiella quasipneumoniae]